MRAWIGVLHHGFLEGIARLDAGEMRGHIVPLALALRNAELHRAILGLPVYARALLAEDEKHERMSREEAASVYHRETTIHDVPRNGQHRPLQQQGAHLHGWPPRPPVVRHARQAGQSHEGPHPRGRRG